MNKFLQRILMLMEDNHKMKILQVLFFCGAAGPWQGLRGLFCSFARDVRAPAGPAPCGTVAKFALSLL